MALLESEWASLDLLRVPPSQTLKLPRQVERLHFLYQTLPRLLLRHPKPMSPGLLLLTFEVSNHSLPTRFHPQIQEVGDQQKCKEQLVEVDQSLVPSVFRYLHLQEY